MRTVASNSITIDCPTEVVFSYLSDLSNYPKWFVGVDAMRKQNNVEGSGAKYLEVAKVPLFGKTDIDVTVIHQDFPRLLRFEAALEPLRPRFMLRLQPLTDTSVHLSWLCETRNQNQGFRVFLLPFISQLLSSRSAKSLDRLKFLVENTR
jgi:hypothetical protein